MSESRPAGAAWAEIGKAGVLEEDAAPALASTFDARKPWLTLQAELVLAKFTAVLIDGDDGRPLLVVTRWALTRSFDDLSEAQAWAARVTGEQAV